MFWKTFKFKLPDGTGVFWVSGNYVRNQYDAAFYGGGHGYVYPFIPRDEVWVEIMLVIEDTILFQIHEVTEYSAMKYRGLKYRSAHARAEMKEEQIRKIAAGLKNKMDYIIHSMDHLTGIRSKGSADHLTGIRSKGSADHLTGIRSKGSADHLTGIRSK